MKPTKWKCPQCHNWIAGEALGKACSTCVPRNYTEEELNERVELASDEQTSEPLLQGNQEPVRGGEAAPPAAGIQRAQPAAAVSRVRRVPRAAGKATVYRWIDGQEPIPNLGGNALKLVGAFQELRSATLAQVAAHLAGKLQVEHPEKFIGAYASRLKKAGLLEVEEAA